MKPMDDIWNDISGLSSPTTNLFAPVLRPPGDSGNFLPPPPSTATMLTLFTTPSNNSDDVDPNKRPKPNPHPQPEHSEKFRRLMKNRESAARSRARKQARADELEHEVRRLAKENAKLKRLHQEVMVKHSGRWSS
ncbi:hypothetical protein E3N88_21577 [Mikania micrantha]|uniref:BZIP domain-containing protein n=1 Tax=Mikania micrantha TaxID=192012 RepID=A0A5N6N7W8_9ASTR|nr:hypothetical protein E3N88_21577 [Mikania micrantha]